MKNRNKDPCSLSYKMQNNNNNNNKTDADLASRVRSGEVKIAVYGLGHVGSPLASSWLRAGAHLIGVDNSSKVLENARKGGHTSLSLGSK